MSREDGIFLHMLELTGMGIKESHHPRTYLEMSCPNRPIRKATRKKQRRKMQL